MKFFCGHTQEPFFILHGGAGPMDPSDAGIRKASLSLQRIARHALLLMQKTPSEELHISSPSPTGEIEGESRLSQGIIASEREQLEFVTRLLEGLEDDEGFNAGYGSALQADGQARLSAALMNGKRQCFSGVISLSEVQHPSRLALELQTRASRVLTSPGHQNLARELQIPVADLRSPARLASWYKKHQELISSSTDCDTVGVVLYRGTKQLTAGTSTGGRGFEEPGRVGDAATVAGTYASPFAAISMTGFGEQIIDDGVAVRIETRVRDGSTLEDACRKCFEEAVSSQHNYGWIACDSSAHWCIAHTSPAMSFLLMSLKGDIIVSS